MHPTTNYLPTQRVSLRSIVLILLACLIHSSHPQHIVFEVQEEQNPPIRLGNIAVEANIEDRPNLEFSIISKVNYGPDFFELNTATGDLSTAAKLDRESLCGSVPKCVLTTLIAASSSTTFLTRFTVNVTIRDANDQGPKFKQDVFPLKITEISPVNSTFQLPLAHDADADRLFKVKGYRLEPQSQGLFDLVVRQSQTSGGSEPTVFLRLRGYLDRESQESHKVTLVAFDGGNPANEAELPIEITVLDANDNAPVFTPPEYRFSIPETHPINEKIKTVTAVDKDQGDNGRIGYEFPIDLTPRIRDLFKIEETTGDISLIKSLDKEGGNTFTFKVSAFDYGSPSKSSEAEVVIEIEDTVNDPPSIELSPWKSQDGRAVVSEATAIGTKVAFVDVKDSDSKDVICQVESVFFNMQLYKEGVYTISLAAALNREQSAEHTVIIRCSDKGNPPKTSTAALSILVEDANDNAPVFTKSLYRMSVKENQETGRRIGTVSATDLDIGANGELRYSIDPKVVEFSIDEDSGLIRTAVANLDRESTSSYTFQVYVSDKGSSPETATASVLVIIEDMNDVWPRFDNASYQFAVSEKMEVNRIIGVVHASDRDLGAGGKVNYLMVSSALNPNPPFSVNSQDGSIVLTGELDYEIKKGYSFVVTAVDQGRPPRNSSVKVDIVIIDENDNSPVIEFPSPDNLSVTLNLDVTPGHEVVKVSAHDPDSGENGRLTYSIIGPNTTSSNIFWINEDTGLITLLSTLTDGHVRSYNVIISVRDNGLQQRATQAILKVDIVRSVDPSKSSQANMTIVVIMVCVTLFVAIIVLTTLCFIKYTDKRNFYAHQKQSNKNNHLHAPKGTTYSEAHVDRGGGDAFFDTVLESSPALQQKQSFSSSSSLSSSSHFKTGKGSTFVNKGTHPPVMNLKNSKKSVTFDDNDVTLSSRPDHGSFDSDRGPTMPNQQHNDSVFLEAGVSTFKPDVCPPLYEVDSNKQFSPHHHHHNHHHHHQHQQHQPMVNFSNETPPSSSMQHIMNTGAPSGTKTNSPRAAFTHGNSSGASFAKDRGMEERDGDKVIDYALQHHNALVRSMRGNNRRPASASRQQQQQHQAARPSSSRDTTDVCSSSSVETSDSGHGSELDVSVVKANV